MAEAVDDGQVHDGAVLAQEAVADDGAEEAQAIKSGGEEVVVALGVGLAHGVERAAAVQEVLRHEDHQDALHAVERKALGGLVPDDVGNAGRRSQHLEGLGAVFAFHGRSPCRCPGMGRWLIPHYSGAGLRRREWVSFAPAPGASTRSEELMFVRCFPEKTSPLRDRQTGLGK